MEQQTNSKSIRPFWPIILLVLVVALVGVLLWQKNNANQIAESLQQQIISLQNQVLSLQNKSSNSNGEIVAITSNETAGWKTYRNDKYGFELKYPNNSVLTGEPSPAMQGGYFNYRIDLPILTNGTGLIQKYFSIIVVEKSNSYFYSYICENDTIPENNTYKFNSIEFKRKDYSEGSNQGSSSYTEYFTIKDNKCFDLNFRLASNLGDASYNRGEEPNVFDQIMSTFKFTK
ncbi:MAG: hypothetical protein Q7R99_02645 [bacterium]|nr:hypothetical protein [bacterium]